MSNNALPAYGQAAGAGAMTRSCDHTSGGGDAPRPPDMLRFAHSCCEKGRWGERQLCRWNTRRAGSPSPYNRISTTAPVQ
jgi:hypothetical protein